MPKIAWLAGCGRKGLIGHTQPRRLAATSVAKRIAQEIGAAAGAPAAAEKAGLAHVGYKIRFNEQLTGTARIKLMTDGILLAETLSDPHLGAYDCLIIDEAHERSLNIDFLLGYLKQLVEGPRQGSLKIIITSATIDAQRFAEHFGSAEKPAPVIEVSGRLFPVEILHRPLGETQSTLTEDVKEGAFAEAQAEVAEQSLPSAVADSISELWRRGPGDILVFLAGEREIRECMEHLRRVDARSRLGKGALEVLPLFSRLSATEQERVFSESNGWRVILSTNVAETSLTVPGVRYVIDSGLARVKRYRYRSKVEQLQVEGISQAAANQRSGRCGRVSNGVCIRLYSELDWQRRTRFTDPEILRSSLAGVILRMKALKLPAVEEFPFLDRPPSRAITDGYGLLHELEAIDDERQLTSIGCQLARLPLDPRIARMLLAGQQLQTLDPVLVIAAALSVQDPRERPMEAQQAADQKHLRFHDDRSDFVSWLKLWQYWQGQKENKDSNRALQDKLKKEFLSVRRLREWTDVYKQLRDTIQESGWKLEQSAAPKVVSNPIKPVDYTVKLEPSVYERLHRALLAGLLGNLGLKSTDSSVFLGTHEIKFLVHPGSGLAKKPGKWLMVAELVDTTRLYGRIAAQVQPDWIEKAAEHLLRRSWSDARWEKKAAQVMAFERAVLYGLPIYTQRRVPFAPINLELSRELMIRGALVNMEWDTRLPFMEHNRRLIADVQALEHRMRRQDILVDEELLFNFFDQSIPKGVATAAALETWWRGERQPKLLFLNKADLMRKSIDGAGSERFPNHLLLRGIEFELSYHFEPGSSHDGVTLVVPIHLLNQVDAQRCEWLIPGMLKDKALAYAKTLPPKIRHRLQPIETFAEEFAQERTEGGFDEEFLTSLRDAIKRHSQLPVLPGDFRLENIPAHCWMRFIVLDEHGRELGSGRDLAQLKSLLGHQAQSQFRQKLVRVAQTAGLKEQLEKPKHSEQATPLMAQSKAPDRQSTIQALTADVVFRAWDFGSLEEMVELVDDQGQTLFGYPALVPVDQGVVIKVFDEPDEAKRQLLIGLRALFALQFKEQVKLFERYLPNFREMSMQFMPLGSAEFLRQQLLDLTIDRACLAEPWPKDQAEFETKVQLAKPRFGLIAQEVGRLASTILIEYSAVTKKLPQARGFSAAFSDLDQQLKNLGIKQMFTLYPYENLQHMPRYLKAMLLRIDKLKSDSERDASRLQELNRLLGPFGRWQSQLQSQPGGLSQPRYLEFRWLLEELRVSLFAQELKTPAPVSVKRLEKLWQQIQSA